MATILQIYFALRLLNRKANLSGNLVDGIGATCRSKVDKTVLMAAILKIYIALHLLNQSRNLVGGIWATYNSKIAKIVQSGNPR